MRLKGDTCRRILLARLDAKLERPYARSFGFDPAQRIGADRASFVVAALTIIRAYIQAGRPRLGTGRTASFELWDDLVRQPICWLRSLMRDGADGGLPHFDDPLKAADQAYDQDPETARLKALLCAWHATFPNQPATVAKAVKASPGSEALHAILDEIGGRGTVISPRAVGRWIERQAGRPLGGLRFERGTLAGGVQQWVVRNDTLMPPNKPTKGTKPTDSKAPQPGIRVATLGGFGGSDGFVSDEQRADPGPLGSPRPVAPTPALASRAHNRPVNGHDRKST
jgi:hypothetical protein